MSSPVESDRPSGGSTAGRGEEYTEYEECAEEDTDSHTCGKCQMVFNSLAYYLKHKLEEHQLKVKYNRTGPRGSVRVPEFIAKEPPPSRGVRGLKKRKTHQNGENAEDDENANKSPFKRAKQFHTEDQIIQLPAYACTQCERHFKREAALRRHVEFDHYVHSDSEEEGLKARVERVAVDDDEEEVYEPPAIVIHEHEALVAERSKSRKHLSDLKEHRAFSCPVCMRSFKEAAVLRAHMLTHSDKRDYICRWEGCSFAFKTKGSLKRHMRRHTGERPFMCEQCNRCFSESGALLRHTRSRIPCINKSDADLPRYGKKVDFDVRYHPMTRTENGDEISGQDAGVDLADSELQEVSDTEMMDVSNTVDIVPSEQNLQCRACQCNFLNHKDLKSHLQSHLVHLPYRCDLCSFATGRQEDLDMHTHIEHEDDEEPAPTSAATEDKAEEGSEGLLAQYRCGMCGYTSKHRAEVDAHIQSEHVLTLPEEGGSEENGQQTFLVVESSDGQTTVLEEDDKQADDDDQDEPEDAEDPIKMLLSLAQQQEDAAEQAVLQPSHALDHEYIEPEIPAQVRPQDEAVLDEGDQLYMDGTTSIEVEITGEDIVITKINDEVADDKEASLDSQSVDDVGHNEMEAVESSAEKDLILECEDTHLTEITKPTDDMEESHDPVLEEQDDADHLSVEKQPEAGSSQDDHMEDGTEKKQVEGGSSEEEQIGDGSFQKERADETFKKEEAGSKSDKEQTGDGNFNKDQEDGKLEEEKAGVGSSEKEQNGKQQDKKDEEARKNRDAVIALQQLIDLREKGPSSDTGKLVAGEVGQGATLHSCPVCHKCFRSANYLRLHLRSHTGSRPHHCTQCNKSFSSKDNLNKHRTVHSEERQFQCGECGKLFKRISHVREHIKIHTSERPFACDVCEKSFRTANACKVHMRTHTDLMPWECAICQRTFREKGSLERHVRTHTGEKPFVCPHCGRCFSEHGTLNRHMKAKVPCTRELSLQRDMKSNGQPDSLLSEFSSVAALAADAEQYVLQSSQPQHAQAIVMLGEDGTQQSLEKIEIVSEEQVQDLQNAASYVLVNNGNNIHVTMVNQDSGMSFLPGDHSLLIDAQQLEQLQMEEPIAIVDTSMAEDAVHALTMVTQHEQQQMQREQEQEAVVMETQETEMKEDSDIDADAVQQAMMVANVVAS